MHYRLCGRQINMASIHLTTGVTTEAISGDKVIGHRGAAGYQCENTEESIRHAHAIGLSWVEVDCMISRDNQLLLFHDDNLSRLANCDNAIPNMLYHDCMDIQLTSPCNGGRGGILAFDRFVELLHELKLSVNLEIKIGLNDCKKTAESLALMMNKIYPIPPLSTPLISSFDWQSLLYFQDKYNESAKYALLSERLPINYQYLLKKYNATDLHLSADHVSDFDVIEVKSHDIPLRLYTVNSVKLAEKLFALGVDAVFSDYPDKIMTLFKNSD